MNDDAHISELIARYLLCLDEKKFGLEEISRLFTDDARVKLPSVKEAQGLEEVSRLHESLLSLFESTHHMSGGLVFTSKSEAHAEVRCPLSVWHRYNEVMREKNGSEFMIARDVLTCSVRRDKDGWRISELKIKCIYRKEE